MIVTAALAVVVFTPRTHAGAAWAQTLAVTKEAPFVHTLSRWANGHPSSEEWRSGVKRATLLYTDDGQLQMESRNDGKREMIYFDQFKLARTRHEKLSPNVQQCAFVFNESRPGRPFYEIPLGGVEVALNDSDIKVVGHEEARGDAPEIYRLRHTMRLGGKPVGKPQDLSAEIDPATRRIRALVEAPRRFKGRVETFRTEVDYPSNIPASVFAPKVQVAGVAATYDWEAENAIAQRTLRKGLGKQGRVTLRAVYLDEDGELWAYWTGAPATRTFTTPGVALEAGGHRNAYPSGLTGLGRTPKVKIGHRINLDVPYSGGAAHFRNVPIRRVEMIHHIQGVLMAFRPQP